MSVSYRILKELGLVYVRYQGDVNLDETMRVFAEYAKHPDCRPGQKQLVDLSGVTTVDTDFPKLMEMQAQKADVFLAEGAQTIIVYFAPTSPGREIASTILRSWEPFESVVALVQDDEAGALALLGFGENRFSEILDTVS